VDKFLRDVRQTIDGLSVPLRVAEERTIKYLCWYLIGKEDESVEVPYVWFEYRKPEIVIPGELRVTVDIEKKGAGLRPRIEKALRQIKLPSYCQPARVPDYRGMQTLIVSYGKSPHPVQDVAAALAGILKAIEPFKVR
jgi:hypothetical protein